MRLCISFAVLALASCQMPIEYVATNGTKTESLKVWGSLGGSETLRTAGGMEWTGNRNKSFGQGAQAAGLAIGAYQAVKINSSNNAVTTAAGSQATAQAVAKTKGQTAVAIEALKKPEVIVEPIKITPP